MTGKTMLSKKILNMILWRKSDEERENFTDVELAICDQFNKLSDKIGFDSKAFRLKLEDAKYIQIPRYDRFVEKAGVEKEDSVLYTNLK
jgi:hypothetical protein